MAGVPRGSRVPRWVLALALGAGLFFFVDRVTCLFQHPYKSAISGWDNSFYFYWLRSPVIGGDFDFRDDLADCATMPLKDRQRALQFVPTETGLLPNKYAVGWAVSNLPFYWLTDLGVRAIDYAAGPVMPRDGFSWPYQLVIHLVQATYAIFSLFAAYAVLRRWFDAETAGLAVILTWLGSFLFVYQTSYLSMAHNVVFAAFVGSVWCTQRLEDKPQRWRWWLGLGFLSGMMVISRYQTAVYLLYPAVAVGAVLVKNPRLLSRALAAGLMGMTVLSLQLAAWKIVYGHWLLYSYGGEPFYWTRPHLGDVLFSPLHGLFYWSPVLLPATIGFFAFVFTTSGWQRWWAVSLVLMYYVNASWSCWWFGASFGSRAFEGCVLFFMAGTAFGLERARRCPWLRWAMIALLLVFAAGNLALSYAVRKDRIPMEGAVTYGQMWSTLGEGR